MLMSKMYFTKRIRGLPQCLVPARQLRIFAYGRDTDESFSQRTGSFSLTEDELIATLKNLNFFRIDLKFPRNPDCLRVAAAKDFGEARRASTYR